ncbi:cytochrome c peroxidase [Chryseobacterium sp. SLBN-27]|uniref:cytochrome-c peroxidase n=1 Tax=Chryseobacterium sp. SLBN-27 TaxID=3042287 RepID=UPI002855C004|nr:cytochrome c peroxidase [Chryseobacterium sp. SLBN-27]MDR6158409.1 cytochrome c peroxidase [Chryseobacterium sp. SLBN-27]
MKKNYPLLVIAFCIFYGFKDQIDPIFKVPENWPKPVYDFKKNPLSEEKIFLGRTLFYDPVLSRDGTISCESCHLQYTAFTHVDHTTSHGIDGKIGNRNSPALMNLAWSRDLMWDGSVHHIDAQAISPIENPLEMDEKLSHVVSKLNHSKKYRGLFYRAYGDSTATGERTLKSLSQFLLTLVSCDSKYDRVMRHEEKFNEYEQKGYQLFKVNCAACHTEPLFTNGSFQNNGLEPDKFFKDGGRIKITGNKNDSLAFKVPTLRNIELSYPYMHDGRFKNLQMVLFHYTNNIYRTKTLSKHLKKEIVLNEQDKNNLIAFLKTLTDETFTRNPKFSYPQ